MHEVEENNKLEDGDIQNAEERESMAKRRGVRRVKPRLKKPRRRRK